MSKFAWIAVVGLFFSQTSFAKEQILSREILQKLVSEYYLTKIDAQVFSSYQDCERPKKGTCIQVACSKMAAYYCDEKAELKDIAMACSNVDGGCIDNVCKRMLSYNCDEPQEIKTIALACKGLYDSDCINAVCSKLLSYHCDEFSELQEVIEMCKNP